MRREKKRDCNIDRIKRSKKQANAFTAMQSNTVKKIRDCTVSFKGLDRCYRADYF